MTAPDLSIDDSVAYHIHRTARLLRAHLLRRIRELGYDATPEQWFVLNRLHHQDGRSQTELCETIFADRPNITRIVDAMERQGWVLRKSDPKDARLKRIYLTRTGRKAAQDIARLAAEERNVIFDGLSAREMKATQTLLGKLQRNIQHALQD